MTDEVVPKLRDFFVWETVSTGRIGRTCSSANWYNNHVYIFGGETVQYEYASNHIIDFDTQTNTLVDYKKSPNAPSARRNHTTACYKDHLIVFAGDNMYANLNDLYKYSLLEHKWIHITQSGEIPPIRSDHCISVIGNKMYMFGGEQDDTTDEMRNDFYHLNLDTLVWTCIQPNGQIPCPRRYASLVTIGSQLYLFAGRDEIRRFNDLWIYDTINHSWSEIIDFTNSAPVPRATHSACTYKTSMFVFGGNSDQGLTKDLWEFCTKMKTWKKIQVTGDVPRARSFHSAAISPTGQLYIFSGTAGLDLTLKDMFTIELKPTQSDLPVQIWKDWKSNKLYSDIIIKCHF